jgi:hypothetical protein
VGNTFLYGKERKYMFWAGLLTGIVIGGNFGVILMALFQVNRKK